MPMKMTPVSYSGNVPANHISTETASDAKIKDKNLAKHPLIMVLGILHRGLINL